MVKTLDIFFFYWAINQGVKTKEKQESKYLHNDEQNISFIYVSFFSMN